MAEETRQPDRDQGTPEGSPAEPNIEELQSQLAEEKSKAEAFYASWQRSAADFQNYKRRVEQEREEAARWANASLILNILPVLDDLERALKSLDSHLAGLTWVEGIYQIYRKFQAALAASGVSEIPADGEPFDPRLHEAVTYAPGEEGRVVSVIQKGYKLGDRVLRPAAVVVGQGGPVKEKSGGDQAADQDQHS
jgi:molecular chaperone GrpE